MKLVGLWWHRTLKKRILSILRDSSSDLKILGQTLLGQKTFTVTQGRKRQDNENTRTSAPREHRQAADSHQARSSQQVGEQRGPAQGTWGTGTRALSFAPFPPQPPASPTCSAREPRADETPTRWPPEAPPLLYEHDRRLAVFLALDSRERPGGPTSTPPAPAGLPNPSSKSVFPSLRVHLRWLTGRSVWGRGCDAATSSHTVGGRARCEKEQQKLESPTRPEAGAPEEGTCEYRAGERARGNSQPPPDAPGPQTVARRLLHLDLPPIGSEAGVGQSARKAHRRGRGRPKAARASPADTASCGSTVILPCSTSYRAKRKATTHPDLLLSPK